MKNWNLVPRPHKMTADEGTCLLGSQTVLFIPADAREALLPIAIRLQTVVETETKLRPAIRVAPKASGCHASPEMTGTGSPAIRFEATELTGEAYRLDIDASGVRIRYGEPVGAFRAVSTLRQLVLQAGRALPCVSIEDAPKIANRGVMIDIGRDKIPSPATLMETVDLLADLKYNQLQLYIEGFPFAYPSFPQVWADGTPLTEEDILRLDAYCRDRFIELVPNQNCFGHMAPWLARPEYHDMAELPEGFFMWNMQNLAGTFDPSDERVPGLVARMMDDLLPCFGSKYFNVGCDETFELGMGKSKSIVEARGSVDVYFEFLLKVYEMVRERGHRMMFWGDIIVSSPEYVEKVPKDSILLEWGYEAEHPFEERAAMFEKTGISWYVCPGTSSWNCVLGRTENMKGNLLHAAEAAVRHNASGYLVTDWGDNGHWQYPAVSWPGYLYGAAVSWDVDANRDLELAAGLNALLFRDESGRTGEFALEAGRYSRFETLKPCNGTSTVRLLYERMDRADALGGVTPEDLTNILGELDRLEAMLDACTPTCAHAAQMLDEYRNGIAFLRHGAHFGLFRHADGAGLEKADRIYRLQALSQELGALIMRHRSLWLARNLPGGLERSTAGLEKLKKQYEEEMLK